ncbi:hypothetical protein BX285_0753 [Streptomyces sp. 1114.5]|uniref:hypothetical protein n=1 Tax=Streptomyces sp. 1114.5 TaxID=1938830 RepID=UPI000EB3B972|nr:hypothetical protein [Streptomyces sp. 1114.5]RKT16418.1 hypothetical protein BX285_0753 [Streptomyces sp. 1114.5]
MTTPTIGAPWLSPALRAALQLYPAHYRRERGEELAEVFAETTAQAGRCAVAREILDLALYGLRVRLGLTGASMPGRVLAMAAPMAVGAVIGAVLAPWVADADRVAWKLTWDDSLRTYVGILAEPVTAMLLLVAALLGRWTAGRGLSLALGAMGLLELGQEAHRSYFSVWWSGYVGMATLPLALCALVLAGAPTDLLPRATWRTRGLVLASAVTGGLLAAGQRWDDTTFPVDQGWFVAMLVVPALLAFTALRSRVAPAALGIVVLALTGPASLFNIWRESRGVSHLLPTVVPVLVLLAVTAVAVHRVGRGGAGRGGAARAGVGRSPV